MRPPPAAFPLARHIRPDTTRRARGLPYRAFAVLAVIAALAVALWSAGCSTRTPEEVVIPDVQPVLNGVNFSEATVLGQVADVRVGLTAAVEASIGLPSEPAVRAAAAGVEASLAKVEAAIAAHPAADVEKLVEELLAAIDQLREILKDRDAEIAQLKDADARFWNRVLIGLGIFCSLGAVANLYLAAQVPVFGPRIAGLLGALAATSFTLAYLASWARENPAKAAAIVVALIATAVGLAWGNHVRHRQEVEAE